ncbi:hypothetical protein QVD17_41724 [Tagetes erecta]|uniref:RRM domain-containing protein n=1 Tax=Tagetes erecta TaxID=13708 RepID=A0AAD8NF24_TARER|nr:hypothetical protein QVD17_41724 [Tagetes erecta]
MGHQAKCWIDEQNMKFHGMVSYRNSPWLIDGRKNKQGGGSFSAKEVALAAVITTFFASKLPPGCSSDELKESFGKFGQNVYACIPKKKNKQNNTFAFVRFTKVDDCLILDSKLKNIKVRNFALEVNLARYDKQGARVELPGLIPPVPPGFPSSWGLKSMIPR